MSEGYVKRLLDPATTLNVLRELPFMTGDARKDRLEPNVRGGQAYLSVRKPDRICYFDLRVDSVPARHLKLHLEDASVSATLKTGVFNKAKHLRPCYYLPYKKNGTTRMMLAPDPGYTGDAPHFFATAAIDGCSVYVEGPAATPKVSHLNASLTAPPPVTLALQLAEDPAAKLLRVQQKIQNMDNRMALIKKAPTHVVERPHYMEDLAPGQTLMRQQFANRKGIPLASVTDYQPFGAVIGLMNNNSWTFYLQKSGRFEYTLPNVTKKEVAFMVMSANEFWPTNVGGVRIF